MSPRAGHTITLSFLALLRRDVIFGLPVLVEDVSTILSPSWFRKLLRFCGLSALWRHGWPPERSRESGTDALCTGSLPASRTVGDRGGCGAVSSEQKDRTMGSTAVRRADRTARSWAWSLELFGRTWGLGLVVESLKHCKWLGKWLGFVGFPLVWWNVFKSIQLISIDHGCMVTGFDKTEKQTWTN